MAQTPRSLNPFPNLPHGNEIIRIRQDYITAEIFVETYPDGYIEYCYVVEDKSRLHDPLATVSGERKSLIEAHLQACIEVHNMYRRSLASHPDFN